MSPASRAKPVQAVQSAAPQVGISPVNFRASPGQLLLSDTFLVLRNILYLPLIIWPPRSRGGLPGSKPRPLWSIIELFGLTIATLLGFGALIVAMTINGWLAVGVFAALAALTEGVYVLQGEIVLPAPKGITGKPDEKWFYINGMATNTEGALNNGNVLSTMFGRPVQTIHNKSAGLILDFLECFVQRDLSYKTRDLRQGYPYLKAALLDPAIKAVVLLSHSQGGIITSGLVDDLLSDLPNSAIQKLEVYTFASAANHFNSPEWTEQTPSGPVTRNVIQHVEHFANSRDFVARIGVLAFKPPNAPLNRFYGRVFEHKGATGHLLEEYYLSGPSILDLPEVKRDSRLVQYLGGKSPKP